MSEYRIPLQIVLYKEGGDWIAHCLNFDVAGDGASVDEALRRLAVAIGIQVEETFEHGNLDNLFSPAESKFWRMFAAGKDVVHGELKLPMNRLVIESTETREYVGRDVSEDLVSA
jgi:predicted RNase H-like HicB family nuclease